MMKNKLMLQRMSNSVVLTALFVLLLACSQTVMAQYAPSGYPIIGAVTSPEFGYSSPPKYKISVWPLHGTVTLLDEMAGIFQYQSLPGYVGEDSFTLVDESPGGMYAAAVFITVTESIQYQVSKMEDTQDGVCDADCSFSEAVLAANASPGMDVIVIPTGTYPIYPQNITDHVVIDGGNIDQTVLLGNGFDMGGADFQLSNLSYNGIGFDPDGLGVEPFVNAGFFSSVNLYRTRITDTMGFHSLTPTNDAIDKMLAFESEFLRYSCGAVLTGNEVIASRIAITEGGVAGPACSSGFAAIATQHYSMPGVVNLFSSSVHNNYSMSLGLITLWPGNYVTSFNMINTSIHNNAGHPFDALIQLWGITEGNVINSTVVGNYQAPTLYAGPSSFVSLTNTILAYNDSNEECITVFSGEIISQGNNFFTSPNGCNLHASDIVNSTFDYDIDFEAYLPLMSFEYIMPMDNQVDVIDGANNDFCPHVDIQRFQRPADGDLDGIAQCDIGAYEIRSKKLDIFANNAKDYLLLNSADLLTISIALSNKYWSAEAEWWIYADTPMGPYYFDSISNNWQPGQGISYQGGIFNVDAHQVLSMSGLPNGFYTFYFNVDTMIDGLNNNIASAVDVEVLLGP